MEKQKKVGIGYALNTYDMKNRLYRGQQFIPYEKPPYYPGWGWYGRYVNYITDHSTILALYSENPDRTIKTDQFSFCWILKQAR